MRSPAWKIWNHSGAAGSGEDGELYMVMEPVLAFDLGGSHIAAAIVDGGVHAITSFPTNESWSAGELLATIERAGRTAMATAKLEFSALGGIAMAAPGPFDYEQGISRMQHKHSALYGVSLKEALSEDLGVERERICFVQDAAAFLLGELSRSGLQNVERVVGITLGTGIGSAFSHGGKVVSEGLGVPPAGEIYDLPWGQGTVEDTISTRSLMQAYRELAGMSASVKEIAGRVGSDRDASLVMEQFGVNLGKLFDVILRDFDPQVIVLGGGISRSSALFLPTMVRQFSSIAPRIQVCDHLDEAPLLGAAEFWRSQRNASK